ncbi:DNA polymerase-3 subunit gamma/tau [Catalinimonas alkaloidigena]|uniref:DNA polymerase III subunit gamma/tau n=1 Tax=Catalinimonas alkaloidigena TaxID=1075417 RepID=UPI002406D702|nr:DNA polymerase III subunit gamma/tau [Catalinimonas alkaloidigena]MDF9800303.1 DNA polymerase-3 subunit gamma/tau [Catalinimonas alkaloidigena]
MENFVVSARKYRPTGFAEVVGQEHITTTLQNAIDNNQLAQALLFCGPRGVGKTTCARILARKINGYESQEQANAMNIYELDAASNNSVDDIRNLIDQVRYPPQQGSYKVYIIDEVHMLSNQAFNAFLKTLEEPPSYAIFILATTEKHKVIPTILSRCQIYDFNRIQVSHIVDHLKEIATKEHIEVEEEALNLIAQKADGALRDALSIFDLIVTFSSDRKVTYQTTIKNLHILDYDYYFRVTDYLMEQNVAQVMLIFDEILKKGFDGHNFIVGLSEHLRNLMVCKDKATVQLLEVSESVQQRYLEQAAKVPASFLLTALNLAGNCDLSYKNSKNQRLHVELSLMKMAYISSAVQMAQVAQAEEGQEGKEVKKKSSEHASNGSSVKPEQAKKGVDVSQLQQLQTTVKIPKAEEIRQQAVKKETVQEEIATVEEKPEQKEQVLGTRHVELGQLRQEWAKFAEQKKLAGRDSAYMVLNQEVNLQNDGVTIPLKMTNTLQMDVLNEVRVELIQYLRKQLHNSQINVTAELVKDEKQRKLYTASEKLNYLMEKNPQVRVLKEKLGLDPDY